MIATSIFHVGQRLTDYSNVDMLVERVARGGFGEVAMGPDRLWEGRWRAIKVLRPDLLTRLGAQPGSATYAAAQARLRANFLQEALTWRGLWPHPNLLTAHFVTQINGQPMLVLDYAERGSMRDLFIAAQRHGAWLPLDVTLNLAQQVAAGLVALHTPDPALLRPTPIVHRDLKPENILLDMPGNALITDFGLARAVSDASFIPAPGASNDIGDAAPQAAVLPNDLLAEAQQGTVPPISTARPTMATATQVYHTQRGALLGTPAYMAPEQWLDAAQAGPPVDAYAFGLVLAELLTGRHPLLPLDDPRLTLADWRQAHIEGQPLPLRQLGAEEFATERMGREAAWWERQAATLGQVEGLVAQLLAKPPVARPSLADAVTVLQMAAQTLGGMPSYTPGDTYPPTVEHQVTFWKGSASTYARFGLYAEALPRIERALTIAPRDSDVLLNYGNILSGLKRKEDALKVYQKSLAQLPEGDHTHRALRLNNIGVCLDELQRYAEAEAAFAEALQLNPTLADAWFGRAGAYAGWALMEAEAGRSEAAQTKVAAGLEHIAEALRLHPDDPTYHQLKQALLQLRDALGG